MNSTGSRSSFSGQKIACSENLTRATAAAAAATQAAPATQNVKSVSIRANIGFLRSGDTCAGGESFRRSVPWGLISDRDTTIAAG